MKTFILYKRRNLLRSGETAWQIEVGRDVFAASSYTKNTDLETFAAEVAADNLIAGIRIRNVDRLETISSPVFVPTNKYIDEPVSSEELLRFWKAYERVRNQPPA